MKLAFTKTVVKAQEFYGCLSLQDMIDEYNANAKMQVQACQSACV